MNFKHWPYWVKGAAIGLVFAFVFSGIHLIIIMSRECWDLLDAPCTPTYHLAETIPYMLFGDGRSYLLKGSLSFGILGVIVGSTIGCLYGKFKNRNLNTGSPPSRG